MTHVCLFLKVVIVFHMLRNDECLLAMQFRIVIDEPPGIMSMYNLQSVREISVIIVIDDYLCYKEPKSSYNFFSYFNI